MLYLYYPNNPIDRRPPQPRLFMKKSTKSIRELNENFLVLKRAMFKKSQHGEYARLDMTLTYRHYVS